LPRKPVMPASQFPASFGRFAPVFFCPLLAVILHLSSKGRFSCKCSSFGSFSGAPGGAFVIWCPMSASVYLGGSRHPLSNAHAQAQLHAVVRAVIASGSSVHVGCCMGVDRAVIKAASPSWFSHLRVFAQFCQSGAGFLQGVSNPSVHLLPPSIVSFLAGGSLQVPASGRLINRSVAALSGCSAAVFFAPGSGSLAVAAHAVQAKLPVFAFGSQPAAIPGHAGQWVQSFFHGFACWQWQAAQLVLF